MKTFISSLEWKKFVNESEYKKAKRELERINRIFWMDPKRKQLIKGKCGVCLATLGFTIDSKHAISNDLGGLSSIFLKRKVNFRERLECSNCHLNQRMRSAVGLVDSLLKNRDSAIWIQESITPLFNHFEKYFPLIAGSEFFGDEVKSGQFVNGIRHENATHSSFLDESLDAVLSFDVLEHVPNFRGAFYETFRVLRNEGLFCWSAPFNLENNHIEIRATVNEKGEIFHILSPEYHGDPIKPDDGILCYQTFGWQILEELKSAGFVEAKVYWDHNPDEGILSLENVFIVARKQEQKK